ncbi:odorant receptor 13a-like [Colletes gigas]|uniref:odorant receptor 13a-like n=1 Tax=Colletes gigas TaxID=935657 RepID=UPI001C9B5AF7|nr:odorant receptor 13a-like [Colletes gigas]
MRRYSKFAMSSKQSKDLSLIATSFYMKVVGIWPAKDNDEKHRRNFAFIYTIWVLIFSVWVESTQIYYELGDFSERIYTMNNLVTLLTVMFKIFILFTHKQKFLELILYSKKNFWHSNYDPYEKTIVDNCKHICTSLICIFSFFAQGTAISYAVGPIIANIGKNDSDRILPFTIYLDLPFTTTPFFEMTFVFQIVTLYHIGVGYLCLDNFLCVLNLHIASQFRILQYRMKNLNLMKDETNLKEASFENSFHQADKCLEAFKIYVKQHQELIEYCNKVQEVFTAVVLGQVIIFSLLICLDGYLVLLADASLGRRLIFTFHITGCMCQLLMFTYSCDCLIQESSQIAAAVYAAPWTQLPMNKDGSALRKDLILVMMRSRVPCCLNASGFFVVSLETYTTVLSTAVSYFTLLREY